MATREQLKRQTVKDINARDAEIEAFFLRLDRFLAVSLDEILGDIETGELKGYAAAQALGGLQTALEQAGLSRELGKLVAIYGRELEAIRQQFEASAGRNIVLNDVDLDITEALINFDVSAIKSRIYKYADDLRATIMRSVLVGDRPNIGQLHSELGGGTIAESKTVINTGIQGFHRAVNEKKAKDLGFDLFLYVGPDDDVTRPFCEERVDQIFTQEEIDEWDNGQGLPANVYLGGYNCRHQLRPLTEETARELGWQG